MEENNNNENNQQENKVITEKQHWKECLCMLSAAFLGGFFAMYFVADQVFDKRYNPGFFTPDRFERQMMKDFNKMYELERKAFDRDFKRFNSDFDKFNKKFNNDIGISKEKKHNSFKIVDKFLPKEKSNQPNATINPFALPSMAMEGLNIKTKIDEDEYKVIVNLASFNGDESKVNYNVSGRKLTIFGKSQIKEKNYEQEIAFSQDFILPQNADISKIKKEKDENNLIIEVPLR